MSSQADLELTSERPHAAAVGGGWFRHWVRRPQAKVRLFCLAHAGGSAGAFKDWSSRFSENVEILPIQLPGRENRWREAALTCMADVSTQLIRALTPLLDRPFAFYGHSLGAVVGFELLRQMRGCGLPEALRLFVASRRAPQLPSRAPGVEALPDDELVAWLQRAGGTDLASLNDERWRRFYLPTLRADLCVTEGYEYRPLRPLSVPLVVYGGLEDQIVDEHELAEWRVHSNASFSSHAFSGGHLFYAEPAESGRKSNAALLCDSIEGYLRQDLARENIEEKACLG